MAKDNNSSLTDRLRGLRERVERKTKAAKADNRAKARRIDREEPETLTEKAVVTRNKLSDAREEASALVEESKTLAEKRANVDINPGESGGSIGDFLSGAGDSFDSLDTGAVSDPLADDGMNEDEMLTVETAFDSDDSADSVSVADPSEPVLEDSSDSLTGDASDPVLEPADDDFL